MNLLSKRPLRASEITVPDLSARSDQLEWWFVQGVIEGADIGKRHFMVSFFRQAAMRGGPDGHMLLVSTLDDGEGSHAVASTVSPQLVTNFNADAPGEVEDGDFDQTVAAAVLNEIARGGPPRPIELAAGEAVIGSNPHAVEWDEFRFRQDGDAIAFSFPVPGTGKVCSLRAAPRTTWFEGRGLGGAKTGVMAYDCCPRLSLSGDVDGKPVTGKAWVDHQWGDYGWITAPDGVSTTLGWDWLGINLDDGRDLIVMVHRDMRTREAVAQYAVCFDGTGKSRIIDDVSITGTRTWSSRATMIDYPVGCRIEIPELAAFIDFQPLADDQEIPVFGLIGAIWEGAGRVKGTIAGKAVCGSARLELHGYGYIGDFADYQKKWVDRIDRTLAGFLPRKPDHDHLVGFLGKPRWSYDDVAHQRVFAEPVWDLMSRGGKHWRPIFGLLLLEALGCDPEPHETMLSAIPELVHNGSVIIDDIEDSSATRRGEETIHRRYGLPTAINAGNTLYFLPLLTVARNPGLTIEQRDAIYRITIDLFVRAHFGQAQDLYWAQLPFAARTTALCDFETRGQILQAHAFKSAAAVAGIAEIVCVIADADEETRAACVRLAESWGVAFQMVDDVNNFSTSQRWGKVRGEDVREGKVTYVTHNAVQLSDGAARARLLEILTSAELRQSERGLAEAIGLIERSGALEASRRDAEALYMADWPALGRCLPNSFPKLMLRATLDKLLGGPFEM